MNVAKDLALVSVIFILVDSVFLSSMSGFFNQMMTGIQGTAIKFNVPAAVLTYVVLVTGLYYLILYQQRSVWEAMVLGWFVYLTYELTNKAIISNWLWKSVIIDGLWGGLLFGITSYLFYYFRV